MSKRTLLPAAALIAAIGVAACSAGAAPATPAATAPPSGAPTVAPTSTPTPVITGIAHPTGANDVVLRLDMQGGFVPLESLAARVPMFTLYGDGRVVFVQSMVPAPEGDVGLGQPIRTAKLSEEQVQSLLELALGEGGLAVAREEYPNPMMADVPSTVFTINADSDSKTVSAMGLGMDPPPGPDAQVLGRLAKLAERLRDFDQGGTIASDPYLAAGYRGVLNDATGVQGVPIQKWPWDDVALDDFTFPADPNVLPQGTHVLTPEQATAIGVKGFENGISAGLWFRGDDGKLYSLSLRPLLPDDKE